MEIVTVEEQARFLPVLRMDHKQARDFFLKQDSYCALDLPPYYDFSSLLSRVANELQEKNLCGLASSKPRDHEKVNHTILNNKDGRHAWRPFQLIHPALYVSLVSHITENANWTLIQERFHAYANCSNITCLSLPAESLSHRSDRAEQVTRWWHDVEQRSIELALDYEYIHHADIAGCYGSIYTHSIAWALHGRDFMKNKVNRYDKSLLGNVIDSRLQDMNNGQTNGIPQGSVLMDLIAEMVLGYADLLLQERLEDIGDDDLVILRYRDDYRVFTHSPHVGEAVLKCLTEVLIGLGMKLNTGKTVLSSNIVESSIKADKLALLRQRCFDRSLQKHLLMIHCHALDYPNSGSLVTSLVSYHQRILRRDRIPDALALLSIVVDIAFRNPRTYAIATAIISKLISVCDSPGMQVDIIRKIIRRFNSIPNTGHMEVWLQRVSVYIDRELEYREPLCRLIAGEHDEIWNNDWITSQTLKHALDARQIVNNEALGQLSSIIPPGEVDLFIRSRLYYE